MSKIVAAAVIFDFDGVLVDSLPCHVAAWDAAAGVLFGQGLPDTLAKSIVGLQTRNISKMINAHFNAQQVDELMREKAKQVVAMAHKVALMPNVVDLMAELKAQNIPFGIASNAPRDFVRAVCETNGLDIKVKLGNEDAAKPKPAPDLFLKCASLLDISLAHHEHCLIFEDSLHGIEAARSAGMKAIGVTSHSSAEQLKAVGAMFAIDGFTEVLGRVIGVPA